MVADPVHNGVPVELPRVLSVQNARVLGITRPAMRNEIARGRWQRLVPGVVLTERGEPTREDWVLVGIELAGPRAALSGWDALRLKRFAAKNPPTREVLILDRAGEHRVAGLVRIRPTRRTYASSLTSVLHPTLPHVPIVHTARAVADTALAYRTSDAVRALVTSAIQREACTPAELVAELRTAPRNGSAHLRHAVEDVLDGARSIAEAEAVDWLRRVDVPGFECNVPIVAGGVVVSVADILWRELRAIAEIDSGEFHFHEEDWKRTGRRHNRLTTAGLALEHYPPSEIRGRKLPWARDVEQWLRARARELGVPYIVGTGPMRTPGTAPPPFVLPARSP